MDSVVTVKFWLVEKADQDAQPLSRCLREIGNLPLERRERLIGQGLSMRLERLEEEQGFLCGEFVRRQETNIPPNARRGRRMEPLGLGEDGSLGHRSAFRLHPGRSVLALQSLQNGVRPSSLSAYVQAMMDSGGYLARPILPREAWEKLNASRPRRFKLRVAAPTNLAIMEDENNPMGRTLRDLKDNYGGADINIEVSVGRKRTSFLDKDAVLFLVKSVLGGGRRMPGVKALKVGADVGGAVEEIDFLTGQLVEKERLDLPDDDVEGHYAVRQEFLRSMVRRHWRAIEEQMQDG